MGHFETGKESGKGRKGGEKETDGRKHCQNKFLLTALRKVVLE